MISGDEIIAFGTVDRNEDLLAQILPVIVLQISSEAAFERSLLATKSPAGLNFVQVDTAVFAYEPILKSLQATTEIPLVEDLLAPNPKESQTDSAIQPREIVRRIGGNGS